MRCTKWLIGIATAAFAATAAAQTPAPPPFRPDRTAEDYFHLRDPSRRGDWSDAYKFILLDDDGDSFLSLGGELRERVELFDASRFGLAGGREDRYLLQRLLLHADLRLGDHVRVFAQLGAHEAFGKRQLGAPDEDHLDVQQLILELRPVEGLTARLGRQEMMFNPLQRFVSFRDGTNVRQNFDGGRVTYSRGPLRLEAFATRPVTLERGSFDNSANRDQLFWGFYASHRLGPRSAQSLDAYWFVLDRENLPGIGRERRHSLGLRWSGTGGRFDWDAEGVWQTGEGVNAWAASADLGYSLAETPLRPRLGLRFDAGSGDGDPNDGERHGFHPLFPSGPYHNEANLTSWTNLVALRPNIRIQPDSRLILQAGVQLKWREDVEDAVYLGPSAPLAATRVNRAREIGQAWTLDANFQLNRNLALRAYYLHHSAGAAILRAGGRSADFVMASATLRF
ncbi:MAG: alginate export family protein [Sphingosinicella sp.]|uniref:alginate export family protein n=1 Tax=Sphingosinicella sp. TaxID=1917971 RepID=UPI0040379DA0